MAKRTLNGLPTMNVAELIAALATMNGEREVMVWLPGSRIMLSNVFVKDNTVLIEGNIEPGSALDRAVEGGF